MSSRHTTDISTTIQLVPPLGSCSASCSEDFVAHYAQNDGIVPQLRHGQFLPNRFQRILHLSAVKEEIRRYSSQYSARLSAHTNGLVVNLMELPDNRRLRRHLPNDLPTRFLV
jgi:hypothetical protein